MPDTQNLRDALQRASLAGGAFERALFTVLAHVEPFALVEALEPGVVVLRLMPSGNAALLVSGAQLPVGERLAPMVKALARGVVEVCVVSDDEGAVKAFHERLPYLQRSSVGVYRLDSSGQVHGTLLKAGLRPILVAGVSALPSEEAWSALAARRSLEVARFRLLAEQHARFVLGLRARRPLATWVLAAVFALVFALEFALGSDVPGWVLRRLGALDSGRVGAGEWWRLVSCTFLHGGGKHLLFNGLALWTLGGTIERLLGTPRYVVVYGVSLLAGSLVSLARLGEGMSVGASGAIWGLLAAEAVLLYHPRSPLPALMKQRARQSVVMTLGINVMASFLPHVDWAAHLGGALAGLATVLLFLPLDVAPESGAPRSSGLLRAAAGLVALVGAAGLAAALVSSRAWLLLGATAWVTVPTPTLNTPSLELPAFVATDVQTPPQKDPHLRGLLFGDARTSPVQVGVSGAAVPEPMDDEALAAEAKSVVTMLDTPPAGATLSRRAKVETKPGQALITAQWTFANGLLLDVAVRAVPRAWWRVDVVTWPHGAS